MTRTEFFERWWALSEELESLSAAVKADTLILQILEELELLFEQEELETLTLGEAAECSGYSKDHLARLIRNGAIVNVGRRHRPRVRRGDVPHKTVNLRNPARDSILPLSSKRQIALSVVTSDNERHDG